MSIGDGRGHRRDARRVAHLQPKGPGHGRRAPPQEPDPARRKIDLQHEPAQHVGADDAVDAGLEPRGARVQVGHHHVLPLNALARHNQSGAGRRRLDAVFLGAGHMELARRRRGIEDEVAGHVAE